VRVVALAEPVTNWVFTPHAKMEMARRSIGEQTVMDVLARPEQRHSVRTGREVLQSRLVLDGANYIVRVFVDTDRVPAEVVTVYRSSKIAKYWRPNP
jgi:Domain of unknown function (DUF4258)